MKHHVIDPLNNLMLGVAKHTFFTWIAIGLLDEKGLEAINNFQKQIKIPSKVGRLAASMSKVYKLMKKDEWKNWTLIYSMICLRDILPMRHVNV